jgi:hypothetical protein
MPDSLLLPAIGLCVASVLTVAGSWLVDRFRPGLPPALWFLIVSLSTPLAWIALQGVILSVILRNPAVSAGFARKWPLYLEEVLFGIALKLWLCGAVCAAVLAFFRRRSDDDPSGWALAQWGGLQAGGAIAAAILVPSSMEYWIDNGNLNPRFLLVTLAYSFLVGLVPVIVAGLAILRVGGNVAVRRYAEPMIALYAAAILWRGYLWHQAVVNYPGSWAVIAVQICALCGVFVGWGAVRRANRASAAALAQLTRNKPTGR